MATTPRDSSLSNTVSIRSGWRWSAFDHEVLEERPGFLMMRVEGRGAWDAFRGEGGGHRFQRVPPNDKRGRTHTSTVTVAVLEEPKGNAVKLDERDLEEQFTRGSGKGGQHRNKTDTCVILKHRPTGIQVRCDGGRSQTANRETARAALYARLQERGSSKSARGRNDKRRSQVGGGARGDKRRTIALQRDTVTDHVTGKTVRAKDYLRGDVRSLH